MKILYNFKPYQKPKKAIYHQTGDEYILDKKGYRWSTVKVEAIVIGETENYYIVKLNEYEECDTSQACYGEIVLLPHGFHKSRLINWLQLPGEQLKLF